MVEDVLDTAEDLAYAAPTGRLDPPFLAALDEAPNIAPIPSLRQRVADGRGRGIAVIYAAQGWASVVSRWGRTEADELAAITSNLVVYGGCKDADFLAEMERLCGQVKVRRRTHSRSGGVHGSAGVTVHEDWEPVLRAHQIATLDVDRGHALILAENLPPLIARQKALFEDRAAWREVVEHEIASVRAENARARRTTARGCGS
jgi:type IV secretion system protein VirD4